MTLLGPGVFVAVVGPSGAGKDSVMRYAAARLSGDAGVVFVRRVVTRPCDPGSEEHDSLDETEFSRVLAAGGFSVAWAAHGHHYGLPSGIDDAVRDGRTIVANVSRRVLPSLISRYRSVRVVAIGARPDVLLRRLLERGREDETAIRARLASAGQNVDGPEVTEIDNSGSLDVAGEEFVSLLQSSRSAHRNG